MVLHIVLLYPVFLLVLYYAFILLVGMAGIITFAGYALLPERYQRWWAFVFLMPVASALSVNIFPYVLNPPPWAVYVYDMVLEPCARLVLAYFEMLHRLSVTLLEMLINAFN